MDFQVNFLRDKEYFEQIADDFSNFIKGKKIIIHNANFDLEFSKRRTISISKNQLTTKKLSILLKLPEINFPVYQILLDALCKRFNIDLSRRTKHNALLDCELLREVYINLLDVKEPKFNLSSENQI